MTNSRRIILHAVIHKLKVKKSVAFSPHSFLLPNQQTQAVYLKAPISKAFF